MQVGKQMYSYLDTVNVSRRDDYVSWNCKKQTNLDLIRKLQKENEKLLRENILLRQQNKQLLLQKEKYLLLNLKSSLQIEEQSRNKKAYSSVERRHSINLKKREIQRQQNQYGTIQSAREGVPQKVAKKTQNSTSQFVTKFKIDNMIKIQRKRFNYIKEEEYPINKMVSGSFNEKNELKKQSYKTKEIDRKSQATQVTLQQLSLKQDLDEDQKLFRFKQFDKPNPNIEDLQKQIRQLIQTQSKLLDRIYQRDDIIQQLQQLFAWSREEPKTSGKQTDRDTIDSTYTPRKSPE